MASAAQRQAEYKTRMRASGFALVAEWIPETERAHFKAYAKQLRDGAEPTGDNQLENDINDILTEAECGLKEVDVLSVRKVDSATLSYLLASMFNAEGIIIDELKTRIDGKHDQPKEANPS